MTIGIIGSGNLGAGFARTLAKKNIAVLISNRRGPGSLKAFVQELGSLVKAVTVTEAAQAEIVLIAVPWTSLKDALAGLPDWSGRIVIDATNPVVAVNPNSPEDMANPLAAYGIKAVDTGGRSSSSLVAEMVPNARVVKAFNHLDTQVYADLDVAGGKRVFFFAGDDAQAKIEIAKLISQIGQAGFDLGSLESGGPLFQLPFGPFAGSNLLKI